VINIETLQASMINIFGQDPPLVPSPFNINDYQACDTSFRYQNKDKSANGITFSSALSYGNYRNIVLPLELQISTLVILDIQALLVKTNRIINTNSPLRKGPSPSNIEQGHILSPILGEIETQYPLLGLSAPTHNVPKWLSC
jgi:hypothetical protein